MDLNLTINWKYYLKILYYGRGKYVIFKIIIKIHQWLKKPKKENKENIRFVLKIFMSYGLKCKKYIILLSNLKFSLVICSV